VMLDSIYDKFDNIPNLWNILTNDLTNEKGRIIFIFYLCLKMDSLMNCISK